jgi:hypothetical protein
LFLKINAMTLASNRLRLIPFTFFFSNSSFITSPQFDDTRCS